MFTVCLRKLCLCVLSGKMVFTLSLYMEGEAGGGMHLLEALFPKASAERPPLPRSVTYLRVSFSIQSEVSFEGAYGNLKRLYDKAAKMYHQLKKCETRKLSPSKKR